MPYIVPNDFREVTVKPWCRNLVLTEAVGDTELAAAIAVIQGRVEQDLMDDFEPPNPDNDVTLELDGSGQCRQYVARRIRAITTVKTRDSSGALTLEDAGTYRIHASLDTGGLVMLDQRRQDWLEVIPGRLLSTGADWWPWGPQTVQLVGKFGWGAVPEDIKRLTALRVYEYVKANANPLTTIQQVNYGDHVEIRGESREMGEIVKRYRRRRKSYAA